MLTSLVAPLLGIVLTKTGSFRRNNSASWLLLLFLSCLVPGANAAYSTWSVESDLKCAKESATAGAMYPTSSDLEIPFDDSTEQVIGIVFPSIFLDGASTCFSGLERTLPQSFADPICA